MSAIIEVRDGTQYWWDSPDIWVVPGNNPNGSPGQPVAGQPNFLWGRAHNAGDQPALGARVNFYWSNPATGVIRSNSTLVGTSFVDLYSGETKEVLCVIPWVPVVVNDGHECVVAEVVHAGDPLPFPIPDPFDPPMYRQVAQKNLTVLVSKKMMMVLPIQVAAPHRQEKHVRLSLEIGGTLGNEILVSLGLVAYRPAKCEAPRAGLSLQGGCDGKQDIQKELKVTLKPGFARAVYLKLWPADLPEGSYLLVRVIECHGDQVNGGMTYVLINREG